MKQSNWLTFLINGIIALVIGLLLLFIPEGTILTIIRYFGALILLAGIVMLVVAIRSMRSDQPYILLMVESIAAVLIGLILVFYTRWSTELFVIIIGIWALIIGFVQIIISIRLKGKINNYILLLINGLLTAILGILLFTNPFGSVVALGYVVGLLALAVGGLLVYFAFKIKAIE